MRENEMENKVETLNLIENTHKIMTFSHVIPMQQPHLLQALWWPYEIFNCSKSATKLGVRDTPKYFILFIFSNHSNCEVKTVQTPASQAPGKISCWKGSCVRIRRNLQTGEIHARQDCPGWALHSFNPCTPLQNICRGQKTRNYLWRHYYTLHLSVIHLLLHLHYYIWSTPRGLK